MKNIMGLPCICDTPELHSDECVTQREAAIIADNERRNGRSINDFTDAELAAMVRNSIYAKNARFGDGPNDYRFLLVMAVPYRSMINPSIASASSVTQSSLLSEDDSDERDFQVYDHKLPASYESRFFATSLQDLDNIEETEEGNEVSE